MKELLIEVCTENNSPKTIERATPKYNKILNDVVQKFRLDLSKKEVYVTPSRILLHLYLNCELQLGGSFEVRGPEKNICFDQKDNPTYIYKKFLKQKSNIDSKIITKSYKGKEYIYLENQYPQNTVNEVFSEFINTLYSSLNIIKKTKNILIATECSIEIIEIQEGFTSSNYTLIKGKKIKVENIESYYKKLKEMNIELLHSNRESDILDQIQKFEKSLQIRPLNLELKSLSNLSEQPTIYLTTISKDLLGLPEEILNFITKSFSRLVLFKKNNKLERHIGLLLEKDVSDKSVENYVIAVEDKMKYISELYNEGLKDDYSKANDLLKNVVFLEDLGTMYDKVQRVRHIAVKITDLLSIGEPISTFTKRAAELCKTDLTNPLVIMNPKLHGKVGRNYAIKWGETQEVAQAIGEYILPLKNHPQLPQTMAGSILSIADKIDTIVGVFSCNLAGRGSDDPYKLKAKADGIIRIIERSHMDISLKRITNLSISLYESYRILKQNDKAKVLQDVLVFFSNRIQNYLEELDFNKETINALVGNGSTNITLIKGKGEFLQSILGSHDLKLVKTSFYRLKNILKDHTDNEMQLEFLVEDQEKKFYENFLYFKKHYNDKIDRGDFQGAFDELISLSYEVEKFMNQIFVYTDDEAVKNNRFNILLATYDVFFDFCDFAQFKNGV